MSNILSGLTTDTLEKTSDTLGGSFTVESNLYRAVIKMAHLIESSKGAIGVSLSYTLPDDGGKELSETIYITNREKKNFYTTSGSDKKIPLPGFTTINDLCYAATGQAVSSQPTESKKVKIWNSQAKAELPTDVDVLVELIGKEVFLGVLKVRENKTALEGNDYVPTADERFLNTIDKVFDASKRTVNEIMAKEDTATFAGEWESKWAGKTKDKYKEVSGGAKNGAPKANRAGGNTDTSIFGQ